MGTVSGKNDPNTNHHGHGSGSGLYRRRAQYAGSWYDGDADTLQETLSGFLGAVDTQPTGSDDDTPSPTPSTSSSSSTTSPPFPLRLRAIVAPHAGYSYSGPTAAYAYAALQTELTTTTNTSTKSPIRQILVLHPSHHLYLKGCAVSGASVLETLVGSLAVDDDLRREILGLSNKFTVMEQGVDEKEHSGEMQYPYLAQILKTAAAATVAAASTNLQQNVKHEGITVLPIMCGSLSVEQELVFGTLLADIIARPSVLTVVSTDFCHWGSRFSYQPTPKDGAPTSTKSNTYARSLPLHEFIESMDRQGMSLIELQQPGAFAKYLQETKNTVCGRHAVAVWMRAVDAKNGQVGSDDLQVNFVRYAQSSPVQSMNDSSVSYAAAVATTTSTIL